MARKTFRERVAKMEEGAWMVNNEVNEIKALYAEMEEENVRLREEVRMLRLKLAVSKRNQNHFQLSAAHGN